MSAFRRIGVIGAQPTKQLPLGLEQALNNSRLTEHVVPPALVASSQAVSQGGAHDFLTQSIDAPTCFHSSFVRSCIWIIL